MITNSLPIQAGIISNETTIDFREFDVINMGGTVDTNQGVIVVDPQTGLLTCDSQNQNIELQQIKSDIVYQTPGVFIRRSNTITPHQYHDDYDNQIQGITPDLFSPYTDVNLTTSINNNTVLQYVSGQFVWDSISSPVVTSIQYSQIQNNTSNYPSIISFNGSNIPTLINNVVGFIPNNSLSINQLYSPNSTSTKQYLASYNSQIFSELITLSDISNVSGILLNVNSLANPSNNSYIQISTTGNASYVQYPNIQFSNIIDASAGLTVAQNNYQNTLLFYIYQNNQTLPPNDNDILVYQASSQQFRHVSQSVLSIDHSQITGLITLSQIEHQNNADRHYFTSTSGTNQYENLTHLNQFIALGYDNTKYLQSTANGYQWSSLSSILGTVLTNINNMGLPSTYGTVIYVSPISGNTSYESIDWLISNWIDYGNTIQKGFMFINQTGPSGNVQRVFTTNTAVIGLSGGNAQTYSVPNTFYQHYLKNSANNTISWQTIPFSDIQGLPTYINNLANLAFPTANRFLQSDSAGNLSWQTAGSSFTPSTILNNINTLTASAPTLNYQLIYVNPSSVASYQTFQWFLANGINGTGQGIPYISATGSSASCGRLSPIASAGSIIYFNTTQAQQILFPNGSFNTYLKNSSSNTLSFSQVAFSELSGVSAVLGLINTNSYVDFTFIYNPNLSANNQLMMQTAGSNDFTTLISTLPTSFYGANTIPISSINNVNLQNFGNLANTTVNNYVLTQSTTGTLSWTAKNTPSFTSPNSVVLTNSTSGVNYATFPASTTDGMFGYFNGAAQFCSKVQTAYGGIWINQEGAINSVNTCLQHIGAAPAFVYMNTSANYGNPTVLTGTSWQSPFINQPGTGMAIAIRELYTAMCWDDSTYYNIGRARMKNIVSAGGYVGMSNIANSTNQSALCMHDTSAAISLILSSGIGSNNIFEFFKSNRAQVVSTSLAQTFTALGYFNSTGNYTALSDKNKKDCLCDDVQDIDYIKSLSNKKIRKYTYKDDEKKREYKGFFAQDLAQCKCFSNCVEQKTWKEGDPEMLEEDKNLLYVDQGALINNLYSALVQVSKRLVQQDERIEKLEQQVTLLLSLQK